MKNRAITYAICLLAVLGALPLAAETGGLRYTITVTEFENRAGWASQYHLGDAWGTVLTDLLNKSGKFIVLGESDMRGAALDEQDFAASGRTAGGRKAPVTGQMTPAQILVKGAITHVQVTGKGGGGVRIKSFKVGGKGGKAEMNITIYMVDSTTGQIIASESVTGVSKSKGLGVAYYDPKWSAAVGGEKNDNVGKAIADAAGQAVDFMIAQLGGVAWTRSVAPIKNRQIYINRGTREGVSPGQRFSVGTVDVIRDPDTGEVLDESINQIASLTCPTVKEKLSICDVTSGGGVKKGMAVHLP